VKYATIVDPKHVYPNANDLQSDEGAMATKGSNIVRAGIDSALNGSKSITFPMLSPVEVRYSCMTWAMWCITESQISISHPGGSLNIII
jgi:hypothetical protein